MATNFIQPGDSLDIPAPSGGVVSGSAYLIGAIVLVAQTTAAQGVTATFRTHGVWRLPKATGAAWTVGAILYWDNTAKNFTTTASGNTKAGYAAKAAASGDTFGEVALNGVV
jgi:predicted RecA/RadA family phage recombinase